MSKKAKVWLIVAASLLLTGIIIFAGVMTMLNWDFSKLSTSKYETNEYKITEKFNNFTINTTTADICFIAATDNTCKVICHEQENAKHSVHVQDDTLTIRVSDNRKWYEYIGIHFTSPKITVYLPESEYASLLIKGSTGNVEIPKDFTFTNTDISLSTGSAKLFSSISGSVKIKANTGNIRVQSLSAGALDLSVSTGNITVSDVSCTGDVQVNVSTGETKLTDVFCKNFKSDGSTGDISLRNVIAAEKFTIKRSTGDISFEGADAQEIYMEADTGDIRGSLLSDKVFLADSSTGKVDVPKTVTGGKCQVHTDTGDIKITINPAGLDK